MIKWLLGVAAILVAALCLLLGLSYAPDTDPAAMRGLYANDRSAFVSADGFDIHYRDGPHHNGIPVVLLHGLGASLHTFEPLIDQLGPEYRVITIDLPGHGLTGPHPAEDYSMTARFAALDAVMAELGVDRFALGGNSMGGEVAWAYALDHPDRVTGLILMNPSGAPREGRPSAFGRWFVNSFVFEWLAQNITPRWFIATSLDSSVSNKSIVTEDAIDRYWNLLRLPGNRMAQVLWSRLPRSDNRFDRLPDLRIPGLILWGSEDRLIPARNAHRFAAVIADSEVVVYHQIGHLPMEEAADQTADSIAAFIQRIESQKGGDPVRN